MLYYFHGGILGAALAPDYYYITGMSAWIV